jgi:hypothetical protein
MLTNQVEEGITACKGKSDHVMFGKQQDSQLPGCPRLDIVND